MYAIAVSTSLPRLIGMLAVAGILVASAAACGSSAQKTVAANACAVGVSVDLSREPAISVPTCAVAPTALQITDVVKGSGAGAQAGASVTVKYFGAGFTDHKVFDASWTDGATNQEYTVAPLGQAQVIAGWNQGLIGAKVGSRRLLVIPADLAYGAEGSPPAIGPNETLIFVVDVVKIS